MLDLIESAIEMKKSLKQLATLSGFALTVSLIVIDIGLAELPVLEEITSQTPDQILCIWVSKKSVK